MKAIKHPSRQYPPKRGSCPRTYLNTKARSKNGKGRSSSSAYIVVWLYTVLTCCMSLSSGAQPVDVLSKILQSTANKEVKQSKIDAFVSLIESKEATLPLAEDYHRLGSQWYYREWLNGDDEALSAAIRYTQKAITLKRALAAPADSALLVSLEKSLYNLGYFHSVKGEAYEAIDAYIQLIDLGMESKKTLLAYLELGKTYNSIGDFHKGLSSFTHLISFYEKDSLHQRELISAYRETANTYALMGLKEHSGEVKRYLDKATETLQQSGIINSRLVAQLYQIEGNRLVETGEFQRAISYHRKTLEALSEERKRDLAIVHNSLARSYLGLSQLDSALYHLHRSEIYDSSHSDTYDNLGDVHIAQQQFEKGLYQYQKAIVYSIGRDRSIRFDEVFELKDLEASTEKNFLLGYLVQQANAWVKYYRYDQNKDHLAQALKVFALADELVDLIRFESIEQQSKLFWRAKGASLYLKAVEACHLLDRPEMAYYFMEKNKALQLLENISNEQAKEIGQLPQAIAKREFELKRNILLAEDKESSEKEKNTENTGTLRSRVEAHKREHRRFMDSLMVAFPDYAKLKNKVDILSYPDFRKNYLSGEKAVLQYILSQEQGYGLLSTAEDTFFFPIDDAKGLNTAVAELYTYLSQVMSTPQKMKAFQMLSYRVFQQLIPEKAHAMIRGKKLCIIPDYTLQQIPFETLIVNGADAKFLIEEVEVRYAYSMSHLALNKQLSRRPEHGFLGFAPVEFEALGMARLRFSQKEIEEIKGIYGGDIILGGGATKARFLQQMGDYKIIHLSTHASVEQRGKPWIAFSDGTLSLAEIYATKNQSDMVVLNGCQTSLGEVIKGEGVMSLARGFFHSGTKSVVSSLWSITDQTGRHLMVDFYAGLHRGLSKSAALRAAKLKYIRSRSGSERSPFYWGGLIVIGDNAGLTLEKEFAWLQWGFALLLLIVLGLVVFFVRRLMMRAL